MTSLVPQYLQSGPLKLLVVAVVGWLGLFTLFISSGVFLHKPELGHPIGIVPNGTVEQRIFSVASLKSFPLSLRNQQTLDSLDPLSYIDISFSILNPTSGPALNQIPSLAYDRRPNPYFSVPITSHIIAPWDAFGLHPANAAQLNALTYPVRSWQRGSLPTLAVYTWPVGRTSERQTIQLSLTDKYTPGDEFVTIIRTKTPSSKDAWTMILSRRSHASVVSKAFLVQRTLALFLWPALFHATLGQGGMAGVVLLWVCVMTAGYACVTVMVVQWAVRSRRLGGEERRGQGAALRWEEEGWAIMNAAAEGPTASRTEGDEDALLLKDLA